MKNHGLLSWHGLPSTRTGTDTPLAPGNHPHLHAALSRRRFMALGVGAGVATGLAGSDVSAQEFADARDVRFDGDINACSPAPIPVRGDPNLGGLHIWLPVPGVEPSAIFHFKGQVAVAEISGSGVLTDTATGAESRLPFLADIRFMSGAYIGVDRRMHNGTFGFVWLDVFGDLDDPSSQTVDNNPGIARNGLFWTMPIPPDSVQVSLRQKRARMCLSEALMSDMENLNNAIALGPSFPSVVDFDVKWQGKDRIQTLRDRANRFTFDFFDARASIAWNYSRSGRTYVSDPEGTTTRFAAFGFERNGKFFD